MKTKTVIGRDPEVQKRIVEGQMNRCREELKKAEHYARAGDIEAARRRFERLRTLVKQSQLPTAMLSEIKEGMLKVELDGLMKVIDLQLDHAIDAAKVDDLVARNTAIQNARQHLGRVVVLGATEEFRTTTEKKIEIIMMTSSASAVATKGAESSRLTSVKREPAEAAHHNERRRYKRFRSPVLEITFHGRKYLATNWSIGGFSVPDWEGSADGRLPISFKAIDGDASFTDEIELVRVDGNQSCFKFLDPTHSSLKLVQRLAANGEVPQE